MSAIEIKRPVAVKVIMTEAFRKQILDETYETLNRNENTISQAEAMYEKTKANGGDAVVLEKINKQLEIEKARFQELKKEMDLKIQAFKSVKEGDEIAFRILEGPVSVKEGDDMHQILQGAEIVLKDWKVVELRGC